MTRLARTRALTGQEWRVLLEAAALTLVAAVAVRGLPLPKAVDLVRACTPGSRSSAPAGTTTPLPLDRLSTLVGWTASRLGAQCLVQAMVLQAILRRRGVAADVVVGAAAGSPPVPGDRTVRRLLSHAWVEHEGTVLMGATGVAYVPICRLGSEAHPDEALA